MQQYLKNIKINNIAESIKMWYTKIKNDPGVINMQLNKGYSDRLDKFADIEEKFELRFNITGNAEYDICCFGLDKDNILSDERYMIFYNQKRAPHGSIKFSDDRNFTVDLSKLSKGISRLFFTICTGPENTMNDTVMLSMNLSQNGRIIFENILHHEDFSNDKGILYFDLFFQDTWKFSFDCRAFGGGIAELLRYFGAEPAEEYTPTLKEPSNEHSERFSPNISEEKNTEEGIRKTPFEKKLCSFAPELISLAKPLLDTAELYGISSIIAKTVLCLDMSGSMYPRYTNGTVTEIINKTVPAALLFDDDLSMESWFFGSTPRKMPDITLENYRKALPQNWEKLMKKLGYSNNEPLLMSEIMEEHKSSKTPVFVIFITDGSIDKGLSIRKLLIESSSMPIFWQFVGVGGARYDELENFDKIEGRIVDNANFFALDDFLNTTPSELYQLLLKEFPIWLKSARKVGIIQ